MKKKLLFLLPAIIFSWQFATAQWTSDPLMNTQLSNLTGEQALPKIAVCNDGHSYIAWFSNESGNYNVRLQLLDKDGYPLFNDNGMLVSDHPQMSSLTDWSLAVDPDNHALITFQDIRNTDNNPVGYRISPNGDMAWGPDGVELSNSANFEPSPVVCATEAGNAVFAWPSYAEPNSEVHLQKVSPNGDLLWGEGLVIAKPGIDVNSPFLFPAGDDFTYFIWHEATGPFYSPTRGLYVQKLDADGNFMWETDLEIYAPIASGIVVSLQMCRDDSGGIVFSWYGNDSGAHFNCWAQYMDGDGNLTMPVNGVVVSTSMARNHMYPAPAFLPQTQEIIVYFSEQDLNQGQRGLYAQKFDLAGNRLWTDEGKQVIALSNNDYSLPMASGLNDMAICIYQAYEFGGVVDSKMQAVMLDSDGDYVWPQEFIDLSTNQSSKLHTVMTDYHFGQWVTVWGDLRNGGGDIYAQNIQPDGTLGQVITSIENPGNSGIPLIVSVMPNPFVDEVSFDISTSEMGEVIIEVFDLAGKRMETIRINKQSKTLLVTIDGTAFTAGFYFYSFRINEYRTHGKIIKQ